MDKIEVKSKKITQSIKVTELEIEYSDGSYEYLPISLKARFEGTNGFVMLLNSLSKYHKGLYGEDRTIEALEYFVNKIKERREEKK